MHSICLKLKVFIAKSQFSKSVGNETTSKKPSEPSLWSLVSAASTSTSSFYPACASLPASKPYSQSTSIGSRVQQQQEVSINLGKENEEDNETEKAQTIETSSLAKGSTGSLTQNEPASTENSRSLLEENCMLINKVDENDRSEENVLRLMRRVAELEAKNEEQRKTITKLKEDNLNQRLAVTDGSKERENLLIRNASLCHQLEYEKREWSIEREQLAMQLDDVTRELELQKMLLNSESISQIVQRWEDKVFDLQGMIYDRDRAIRAQQQRISELVKNSHIVNDTLLSSVFASIKGAILQLFATRNLRSLDQSIKTLATALQLTSEEEAMLKKGVNVH
ncbi:unnamed protein product [Enterobius vermicularis]|uniref:GRIP domain-containing protein n=1 Tax=Enterobius vermicularis TaxID=51028 RepID=A0A3P6I0D2_ENTVE|nr:unnamed protein product [Enterobius vermicularis]